MRACRNTQEAGFTLVEVLTVVVIIGVLAAMMLGMFLRARAQSAVAASKGNLRNIATALETYFVESDEYPAALAALVPIYARAIPGDSCTKGAFAYDTSMGGTPPTDYKISIAFPLTNPCRLIATGLSYTPAGGLVDSP